MFVWTRLEPWGVWNFSSHCFAYVQAMADHFAPLRWSLDGHDLILSQSSLPDDTHQNIRKTSRGYNMLKLVWLCDAVYNARTLWGTCFGPLLICYISHHHSLEGVSHGWLSASAWNWVLLHDDVFKCQFVPWTTKASSLFVWKHPSQSHSDVKYEFWETDFPAFALLIDLQTNQSLNSVICWPTNPHMQSTIGTIGPNIYRLASTKQPTNHPTNNPTKHQQSTNQTTNQPTSIN